MYQNLKAINKNSTKGLCSKRRNLVYHLGSELTFDTFAAYYPLPHCPRFEVY